MPAQKARQIGLSGVSGKCSWDCGACCTQEDPDDPKGSPAGLCSPERPGHVGSSGGQMSLHAGAFPGTLTLGSPEWTLGAIPHEGRQWLWFVVSRAGGAEHLTPHAEE